MKTLIYFIAIIVFIQSNLWADSFNGYPCTDDCSGHEAGYEWAKDNYINDEDDCASQSQSFSEGCVTYVQENSEYKIPNYRY
jgi:hypothetical protein